MRRAGQFLAYTGVAVGVVSGLSLLLPPGAFSLSWLVGVALVKLAFVSSLAMIAGGAILQRTALQSQAKERALPRDPREFTVRRATRADARALAEFMGRTFEETFGAQNSPEDMAAHLAQHYGVPQQTEELENPDYVTILMERGLQLAAFAQLRRHQAPACVTGEAPVELYRFYVDAPWHGTGAAQRLMSEALRVARELGGRTVWLGVFERNPRAIAFYEKCGFRIVGAAEFLLGADYQNDYVMVTALAPAAASA